MAIFPLKIPVTGPEPIPLNSKLWLSFLFPAMQLHQRREHQASLPPSPLPNMDLHSEMPFAYDMAGDLPIYHLTASTAKTSQSSMH